MPCPFSEKFLQIIWNERMLAAPAHLKDGRQLRVLSVGLWNRGAGPDFSHASVLLGDELRRGAVELHRRSSEWFEHGHDRDPAYRKVVLHVVWEDDARAAGCDAQLPTIELKTQLHPEWNALFHEVVTAFYPKAREVAPGACSLRWALTDDDALTTILAAAGWSRFMRHGKTLLRACADGGADQALYEMAFDGLGYANNRTQFRQLARQMPLRLLPENDDEAMIWLCGSAGLLPDPTQKTILPEVQEWLAGAWQKWWQSGMTTQPIDWNTAGGRPLNSVLRRIAAAAEWLAECRHAPARWLEAELDNANGNPKDLLKALLTPAAAPTHDRRNAAPNWRRLRDFDARLAAPAELLGRERRVALTLNIWLPYLGATAELRQDDAKLTLIRKAWELLPRAQSNHLLAEAAQRFLAPPSRAKAILKHAAHQQGMMEIYHIFCLALNHDCNECPFVTRS